MRPWFQSAANAMRARLAPGSLSGFRCAARAGFLCLPNESDCVQQWRDVQLHASKSLRRRMKSCEGVALGRNRTKTLDSSRSRCRTRSTCCSSAPARAYELAGVAQASSHLSPPFDKISIICRMMNLLSPLSTV
jgi:hypothetical protein